MEGYSTLKFNSNLKPITTPTRVFFSLCVVYPSYGDGGPPSPSCLSPSPYAHTSWRELQCGRAGAWLLALCCVCVLFATCMSGQVTGGVTSLIHRPSLTPFFPSCKKKAAREVLGRRLYGASPSQNSRGNLNRRGRQRPALER